jgi:hypothetical protein
MPNTQALREQRANLWAQMQEIMARAESESRDFTADESTTYNRLEAELDTKGVEIDRAERHEARATEFNRVDRTGVVAPAGDPIVDDEGNTESDYATAFNL